MPETQQDIVQPRGPKPGESIRNQPWVFVGLALTLGLTTGLLFRMKTARKVLSAYLFARRFI